jgi:hypothetical protein
MILEMEAVFGKFGDGGGVWRRNGKNLEKKEK